MQGTYVILARISSDTQLEIGRLGTLEFGRGLYAYVGSALRGLEERVKRHLRREKKKRWHIDYFLTQAQILDVIYAESDQKRECEIAGSLAESLSSIGGFGTSDCKCESHLFYGEPREVEDRVIESFELVGLEPRRWSN